MNAASSSTFEAGRLTTELATAKPVVGPRGHLGLDQGAASASDLRSRFTRHGQAALTRIERALCALRDARDRRHTVRELRRLSPKLLADIGIEPESVEQVVAAAVASHRRGANGYEDTPAHGSVGAHRSEYLDTPREGRRIGVA